MNTTATESTETTESSSAEQRRLEEELEGLRQKKEMELAAIDAAASTAAEALATVTQKTEAVREIATQEEEIRKELHLLMESRGQAMIGLAPEQIDEALAALRAQFDKSADQKLQEGYEIQERLSFDAVEKKLRADNAVAARVSLYKMVQAGSRPDVVCEENGRFCIMETFDETLSERANCVYDGIAEMQVGSDHCNGNAVDQSRAMGIRLLDPALADNHLKPLPGNKYCYDYLQASREQRRGGDAPYAFRDYGESGVGLNSAYVHFSYQGWRGVLWV